MRRFLVTYFALVAIGLVLAGPSYRARPRLGLPYRATPVVRTYAGPDVFFLPEDDRSDFDYVMTVFIG